MIRVILTTAAYALANSSPIQANDPLAFGNAELVKRLTTLEQSTASACTTLPDLPQNPICRDEKHTTELLQPPGRLRRITYVMKCATAGRDCAVDGKEDTLRKWVIGSDQPDSRLNVRYLNDPKSGKTTALRFWLTLLPEAP